MHNIIQLVIFVLFCVNATLAGNFLVRFMLEEKPKSGLNSCVHILLGSSIVWSVGMGFMSLQENDTYAYYFRTFGILGTFIFMVGVQFALSILCGVSRKIKYLVNGLSLLGIPIFFAYSTPGQTIFVHNQIGTTFYFKQGPINVMYSLYFCIVSLNIFLITLHTARRSPRKRTAVASRRFLVVEFCIFTGAIFDMVLPSLGIPALPGSAITHFWGVSIFWLALHEMFKSEITIANMSEYVYESLNTPVLIFNDKYKLKIINNASSSFFDIEMNNFLAGTISIRQLFDTDDTIFEFEGNGCNKKVFCKENGCNCEMAISRIKDSYHDTIGFICLVSDLTEHEQAVAKLEQAKIAADSANMSKSLFLANMSHEIRTPLNAILGFSEIALTENVDEVAKGYFNEIKQAGNVLLTVINEILNISKIEMGKSEIENGNYKSSRIIKDVELITRANANKKGLDLRVGIDSSFPEDLHGDSNKIREILLNILGNAVKYTQVGGIEFTAYADIDDDRNALLHFEVTDTGIGIRPEDMDTIFDKFTRVDAKMNSATEGTGLGLSITKGLVELLGGTIKVKSEYGVGTTFIVEIPQQVTSDMPIQLILEKSEPAIKEKTESKPVFATGEGDLHFLVVDDNEINLKVAVKFLEKYNARVDICTSGAEAIELCKENAYNIVFMDHMMPGMDGVEAMKKIRMLFGYESGSSQKIVALTANAVDTTKQYLLLEGFDEFISKPISRDTLEQTIGRILVKQE